MSSSDSLKPIPCYATHVLQIADVGNRIYKINMFPLKFIRCVPLATEQGIEDIATKFEEEYVRCVRNEEECVCSVCL